MKRVLGVISGMLLLAGCSTGGFHGLYDTPLPGGAELGDHPFHLTAQFADVLDLVPQASVKVDDVAVGRVDKIDLSRDEKSATVSMTVNGDLELPADAYAQLKQSSLLGEKFVELEQPAGRAGEGRLAEGAAIPLARTDRGPEVEEVLGALSLLLNGGGLQQLSDITRELNRALVGNEADIRLLLSRVDTLATGLDGQKGEIVQAIDGLNRLSSTLVGQRQNLATALDDLGPGIQVVAEQRDQLVGMLQSLDRLSGVAVDTVHKSKDQLLANLRALAPTLQKLAEAGDNLPKALKILPTYPLPDIAGNSIKGDYGNVDVRLDLDLDSILQNVENAGRVTVSVPNASVTIPTTLPPLPLPAAPGTGSSSGGLLGGLLGNLLGGGR
ncbi:MCE family protein [Amycolatopsis acidicola]|uniref:MCE family protein n=1 Tax=Amycolatopsis acidicola TaxID=2596893 RepID=A0A5N0UYL6_9PSEU|nr:MCE family protein [Amycolatopsis acidicola]KAA9156527.1 MCE family protein [Amycolatopsis acidicola]